MGKNTVLCLLFLSASASAFAQDADSPETSNQELDYTETQVHSTSLQDPESQNRSEDESSATLEHSETSAESAESAELAEPKSPENNPLIEKVDEVADSKPERMTVTGSHIKRVDQELASPVIVIDREKIDQGGHLSVGELLVESNFATGGDVQKADWNGNEGGSIVGIKGLSPSETLYLLNGRPMPRKPINSFWHPDKNITADLSMIPTAAIERIEILTDGASALYGSEAIGGVVNIITLQNYDSTKVTSTYRVPNFGKGVSSQTSVVSGLANDNGSFLISWENRKSEFWRKKDLDTVRLDLTQSKNLRDVTNPGSFKDASGIWFPNPNCEAQGNTVIDLEEQGTKCATDLTNEDTLGPKIDQHSIYANFERKLTDSVSITGDFLATTHRSEVRGTFPEANLSVPASVWETHRDDLEASYSGINLPTDSSSLSYNYGATELGGDWNEQVSHEFAYTLGFNGTLLDEYDWNIHRYEGVHRGDWNFHNNYLTDCVEVLMAGGFEGQSFDPFAPIGQRASGNGLAHCKHDLRFKKFYKESKTEAILSGYTMVGNMSLDFAVGVSHGDYTISAGLDPASLRSTWGFADSYSVEGRRTNDAAFFETNFMPFPNLSVNFAGRFDKFSDVDSTFNPKFAVSYKPIRNLKLRSSVGTSFRAPYVAVSQSDETSTRPGDFVDLRKCEEDGIESFCDNPYEVDIISGSPNNLKPETSQFLNLGMIYEISERFNVAADYWQIDTKDIVSNLNSDLFAIAEAESKGVDLSGSGIIIERKGSIIAGDVASVSSITIPWVNISERFASGLNLRLEYKGRTLSLVNSYNHMYHVRSKKIPGLEAFEGIGTDQNPRWPQLRWRNHMEFRYKGDITTVGFDIRTLSGFSVQESDRDLLGKDKVNPYSELDAHVAVNVDELNLIFGVKNLLDDYPRDKDAEFRDSVYGNYINPVGRRYFVTASYGI